MLALYTRNPAKNLNISLDQNLHPSLGFYENPTSTSLLECNRFNLFSCRSRSRKQLCRRSRNHRKTSQHFRNPIRPSGSGLIRSILRPEVWPTLMSTGFLVAILNKGKWKTFYDLTSFGELDLISRSFLTYPLLMIKFFYLSINKSQNLYYERTFTNLSWSILTCLNHSKRAVLWVIF